MYTKIISNSLFPKTTPTPPPPKKKKVNPQKFPFKDKFPLFSTKTNEKD